MKKSTRIILVVSVFVVLFAAGTVLSVFRQYTDFTVESTVEQTDAGGSHYVDFRGRLLRYLSDGAFYTDYSGDLIWNETYEMSVPSFDECEDYGIIFDKGGTSVFLFTSAGGLHSLKTTLPITEACVADGGVVAVLMQEESTGYLSLYDADGAVLASGELHANNSGYPVSVALSSDGRVLAVAMLSLADGAVNSVVNFYDFGSAGQEAIDNLVASHSFSNMLIPEVSFFDHDKLVAFGDTEFAVFNVSGNAPKLETELFLTEEVKSLFYNDNYFGTVTGVTNEDGEYVNRMTVYSLGGRERFSKDIEISYKDISLLSNNEIFVSDGSQVNLYSRFGVKKFTYRFDGTIYEVIPQSGSRNYVFVESGGIERAKLER